jgi:hypothetical protein
MMKMIPRENWFELAVFCMDFHSGMNSRGYRLLSKLKPTNFSSALCAELRESEMYQYLVDTYGEKV